MSRMRKNKADILATAMRLLAVGAEQKKVLNMVYEHARTEGLLEMLSLEENRTKQREERRVA